jgi:hypothetical protein
MCSQLLLLYLALSSATPLFNGVGPFIVLMLLLLVIPILLTCKSLKELPSAVLDTIGSVLQFTPEVTACRHAEQRPFPIPPKVCARMWERGVGRNAISVLDETLPDSSFVPRRFLLERFASLLRPSLALQAISIGRLLTRWITTSCNAMPLSQHFRLFGRTLFVL